MQISTLLTALGLAAISQAYVVEIYKDHNCSKDKYIETRNVWDNTCAKISEGFYSVKVVHFGGKHQKFRAYESGFCTDRQTEDNRWVGGDDDFFAIGNCIPMDKFNVPMRSLSSYYA